MFLGVLIEYYLKRKNIFINLMYCYVFGIILYSCSESHNIRMVKHMKKNKRTVSFIDKC